MELGYLNDGERVAVPGRIILEGEAVQAVRNFVEAAGFPTVRGVTKICFVEVLREAGGNGFIETVGVAAVEFGADGIEIHEPALEQCPCHRLQECVMATLKFVDDASEVARPERFELPTTRFEAEYSIQLSYGRVFGDFVNRLYLI